MSNTTVQPDTDTTVRAVLIPADDTQTLRTEQVEGRQDALVRLLGSVGTEHLLFADGRAAVVMSATAKHDLDPVNVRCTRLVERFSPGFARHDRVKGTAVVVGIDTDPDSDAVYAELPEDVLVFITNMWGHHFKRVV